MNKPKTENSRYNELIERLGATLKQYNIAEINQEETAEIRKENEPITSLVLLVLKWDILEESLLHAAEDAREHGGESCINLFYDSSTRQARLTLNPYPEQGASSNSLSNKSPLQIEIENFLGYISKGIKNYEHITGHRKK